MIRKMINCAALVIVYQKMTQACPSKPLCLFKKSYNSK